MTDKASGSSIWMGAYCWRVRTTGAGSSAGDWSTGRSFTRTWVSAPTNLRFYNDTDGPMPRTSADADFATGSTKTRGGGYATWSTVAGAATYEIQVAASRSFSPGSVRLTQSGVRSTTALIPHLSDDTYYFRVRATSPSGVTGDWTIGDNAFTVEWFDAAWSTPSKLFPLDSSTASEIRVGWTPMAGATYYEYQLGTNAGCFWDPSIPLTAPDPFGDWVNKPAKYDEPTPPTLPSLQWTSDPRPTQCRLSEPGATTMNNWVTLSDALDDAVFANITKRCTDDEGTVLCTPAGLPVSYVRNWGAGFHGATESAGGPDDGQYSSAYSIYWRVRPVYKVDPANESAWKFQTPGTNLAFGSWTRYAQGGANRQHRFDFDLRTASPTTVGTRCDDPSFNPAGGCLAHGSTYVQAGDADGEAHATSMQFPVFTWKPFAGAGGYIVQIARDPNFNSPVDSHYEPAVKSLGFGFQQSWAPKHSYEDNSEGTGYWWRVIPCTSSVDETGALSVCTPLYGSMSGGVPQSTDPAFGFTDLAVAQTFVKRTDVTTQVIPNFSGANPMIRWTNAARAGGTPADWAHGIDGAEYYEVQLSTDPHLESADATTVTTIRTTSPRIVPMAPGSTTGTHSELADGEWFYRVRAVDVNKIEGAWSDVSSFTKRQPAPTTTSDDGGGPGSSVSWDSTPGADSYEVEWSTDGSFSSGVSNAATAQTSFRIPNTDLGTRYWRVRARLGGADGQWSAPRAVAIVPAARLRYGLDRQVASVQSSVTVTGELSDRGSLLNGKTVQLQRKSTTCGIGGAYNQVATAVTGRNSEQGQVKLKTKVGTSGCYRLAYAGDSSVLYSAPFAIASKPVVGLKVNKRIVRNGSSFCVSASSKTALTGTARIEYKVGKKWMLVKSAGLNMKKSFKVCGAIRKAGKYSIRLNLVSLRHPTQGYSTYADSAVSAGTMRVNNLFKLS